MVKANYSAWHINPKDFSNGWTDIEKLQFFARYAILAPSGHNTQPWQFQRRGESLVLGVNPQRELPFSGALAAEPYVSLGTCSETLRLAALGFGFGVDLYYKLDKKTEVETSVRGRLVPQPDLLKAITERTSNRSLYKDKALPPELLKDIVKNEFNDLHVWRTRDKQSVDFLARQTKAATETIMSNAEFRAELSKWVRNNVTKQYDGMPAFTQGMPTPPSLIARHIIKHVNIAKGQAKTDAKRLKHSAEVILICVKRSGPKAYLDAGRLFARICVLAQSHGIASSGVGAAVIDPQAKQNVAEHFKLTEVPTALIRLGYATKKAKHTPRWPLEKVLT